MTGKSRDSKYVTLNIEPPAREALARFAYALTGRASRRVNQTMAVTIACDLAMKHLDEAVSAIGETEGSR